MEAPIAFDRVADLYDRTRSLPEEAGRVGTDALARAVGGGRLLEVGVGTGRWARPLQKRGLRVTGVDVARRMLSVGRGSGLTNVLLADGRLLPFRDRAFDCSMSNHVLHLVREWPKVLTELARVTRDRYLSLLEFSQARPDLPEEYRTLCAARGIATGPPGLAERKLRDRLAPDSEERIGRVDVVEPASEVLGYLERRAFRDTWAVPEADHRAILAELAARHVGGEVREAIDLRLAAWDPSRLRAFVRALPP